MSVVPSTCTVDLMLCLQNRLSFVSQVGFELGVDKPQPPFASGWRPSWTVAGIMVPRPYVQQTDTSLPGTGGVVTNNDLALVWLNPKDGVEVGDVAGWNSYGTNGYSFSQPMASFGFPNAPASAMVTAFGYPYTFDDGWVPQISNSAMYNYVASVSLPAGQKPPPTVPLPTLKNVVRCAGRADSTTHTARNSCSQLQQSLQQPCMNLVWKSPSSKGLLHHC
jgi:hypothetical protein